jgi:hypothetical protein
VPPCIWWEKKKKRIPIYVVQKPNTEPLNTSNIQHDPPFTIKTFKKKDVLASSNLHAFNFTHHKRPHPVSQQILSEQYFGAKRH